MKLIKNTFYFTLGNMLPQAAQFVLLPIYTRFLSPADYGIINSMAVVTFIVNLLFTLAIDRAVFRLYYDFETEKEKRDYLGSISIGLVFTSIPILIIIFLLRDYVSLIFENIPFYPFFTLVILSSFFHVFFLIPKSTLYVKEKAKAYVGLSLLEFITKNIYVIIFVVYLNQTAIGYFKGYLFGILTLLPLFIYINIKHINFTFNLFYLRKSLRFSMPILPTLLTTWIISLSDRVFIERYYDLHDVGIYSLGYRIAGLSLIIISAFHKAYVPYYFKTATELDDSLAKEKLGQTNMIYLLIIIVSCFAIAFFSKEGVILLFDDRYLEAYRIIAIVVLARLIGLATGIFQIGMYQVKNTMLIMWISIAGAIVTITLNFLLIPIYGIYGAAWATVGTTSLFFIVKYYFYYKKGFYIPIKWRFILPTLIGLIFIYIIMAILDLNIFLGLSIKILIILSLFFYVWNKYKSIILKFIPLKTK